MNLFLPFLVDTMPPDRVINRVLVILSSRSVSDDATEEPTDRWISFAHGLADVVTEIQKDTAVVRDVIRKSTQDVIDAYKKGEGVVRSINAICTELFDQTRAQKGKDAAAMDPIAIVVSLGLSGAVLRALVEASDPTADDVRRQLVIVLDHLFWIRAGDWLSLHFWNRVAKQRKATMLSKRQGWLPTLFAAALIAGLLIALSLL